MPTSPEAEPVQCWSCPHDVDDHDVLARCLDPACGCGWDPERRPRHRR